ncbi:MAG: hypothetical protein IPH43_16040 [Xanthomonadales bacterium]|nr:hypothetical protein [Xanthomonadales bacterium]
MWFAAGRGHFSRSAQAARPGLGWPMYAVDGAHLGLVAINILPFVLIVLLLRR